MGGDGEEIKIARAEGTEIRRAPEGLRGEKFRALLGARRIHLGGEAVERNGATIIEKRGALAISTIVGDPIGIHHIPAWAENGQHATEIGEVIAQLHERHQIELPENFRDVMDGGLGAFGFPELADIPDRDIDRLIQFRRWNIGGLDAFPESEQPFGDFRGDFAVVHGGVLQQCDSGDNCDFEESLRAEVGCYVGSCRCGEVTKLHSGGWFTSYLGCFQHLAFLSAEKQCFAEPACPPQHQRQINSGAAEPSDVIHIVQGNPLVVHRIEII